LVANFPSSALLRKKSALKPNLKNAVAAAEVNADKVVVRVPDKGEVKTETEPKVEIANADPKSRIETKVITLQLNQKVDPRPNQRVTLIVVHNPVQIRNIPKSLRRDWDRNLNAVATVAVTKVPLTADRHLNKF
jgi:predicted MPP superfamily phosphohydrolase